MIDWASFVVVALVSLVGACALVASAALGIRLANGHGRHALAAKVGAVVSFGFCGAAVLFGVFLIVPAFS